MSKPVFRFNLGQNIIVFDLISPMTLDELTDTIHQLNHLKWFDGTKIDVNDITDLRMYDVECPVAYTLTDTGLFVKQY